MVKTTDITFPWGEQVHYLEHQFKHWRNALFQDVQESFDQKMLYFLYDPAADEQCGTTGHYRKGEPGLVLFNVEAHCFAGLIPLRHAGTLKFLLSLKCPSPQGGSSLILVTDEFNQNYRQNKLHIYRLDMTADGKYVAESRSLLIEPIPIDDEYICSLREDAPEIVVLAGPGMHVYRIDCMAQMPAEAGYYSVPGADLSHFYDGFLNNGKVILLSAHTDGLLDWSRVHVLSLEQPGQISTQMCRPDPKMQNHFPMPRKECAIDSVKKGLMIAGGERLSDYTGGVTRLRDYWLLKTAGNGFEWEMIQENEMPCDLIEPRLTVASNSGNIYLWGDYDIPVDGFVQQGTHLRIFRITGLEEPHPYYHPQLAGAAPSVEIGFQQMSPEARYASIKQRQDDMQPLIQQKDPERYWSFISPSKTPILGQAPCCPVLQSQSPSLNMTVDQPPVYNPLTYRDPEKLQKKERKCCLLM